MIIEEGKFYRTRDGKKVGPMKLHSHNPCIWWVDGDIRTSVFNDGRKSSYGETPGDLISEWTDEPTGPVRTVTRKEIVPGQYGDLVVDYNEGSGGFVTLALTRQSISLNAAEARAMGQHLAAIADALDEQAGAK